MAVLTQEERDDLTRQNAANIKRQADASVAATAELVKQGASILSAEQEAKIAVYREHLKVRLGPTVITTGTLDSVTTDIVNDAFRMTEEVWPRMKTFLGL